MNHPAYTVGQITAICCGTLYHSGNPPDAVTDLLIDSRRLIHPEGCLFVALVTERNDGHRYIRELYDRGVRSFLVSALPGENVDRGLWTVEEGQGEKGEGGKETIENGKWKTENDFSDCCFILVPDTLKALQAIGAFHRSRFAVPVVGITGSNGKTIIKEWMFQLLSPGFQVIRSPKSFNSQIGVPLSVLKMDATHQLALFEAGISRPGEMTHLETIIRPDVGIFSNIGTAHDEHFTDLKQKVTEKLKLFIHSKVLVYRADYQAITQALDEDPAYAGLARFTWSRHGTADLSVTSVEKGLQATSITVRYRNEKRLEQRPDVPGQDTTIPEQLTSDIPGELTFTIPFTDDASIENAIHCFAALTVLESGKMLEERKERGEGGKETIENGKLKTENESVNQSINHSFIHSFSQSIIQSISQSFPILPLPSSFLSRFSTLVPVALRLELKEAVNHCSLINDYYNSDINSLSIALDFLAQQNQHQKKSIILSDILQSGRVKEELYRDIAAMLVSRGITRIIGIGRDMVKFGRLFPGGSRFFATTDAFLQQFPLSEFHNETILLKGARLFEFEKISRLLQQKAHETVMEVNLDALVHNLNYFRSQLTPGTKTMVMVKAFSYGSGSYEIANVLQFHHADYLAVAYADEGVELRSAGIHLPIMVMSPEESSLDLLLKYNLEPEIYNFRILDLLLDAIGQNESAIQDKVKIHIKLDSGMHRLGFQSFEIDGLMVRLHENRGLHVRSVFSHLAASEDPAEDEFTRQQIRDFREMSDRILNVMPYPVMRHILNSAGIGRFPEAQFDMVRLGIGLYGVGSSIEEQSMLRNVSTLRSVVTQVKHIRAGETIGYNRSGKADRDCLIAIIPVGYADGLDRRLGNGKGVVYIHGRPAQIIGNVCMDLTMAEVGEGNEGRGQWAVDRGGREKGEGGIENGKLKTENEVINQSINQSVNQSINSPSPVTRHASRVTPHGDSPSDTDEGGVVVREGDEVIIFGDEHPVTELAARIGTIPYEVLTGISRRVKRIYFYE
jgi:alanine racemase